MKMVMSSCLFRTLSLNKYSMERGKWNCLHQLIILLYLFIMVHLHFATHYLKNTDCFSIWFISTVIYFLPLIFLLLACYKSKHFMDHRLLFQLFGKFLPISVTLMLDLRRGVIRQCWIFMRCILTRSVFVWQAWQSRADTWECVYLMAPMWV